MQAGDTGSGHRGRSDLWSPSHPHLCVVDADAAVAAVAAAAVAAAAAAVAAAERYNAGAVVVPGISMHHGRQDPSTASPSWKARVRRWRQQGKRRHGLAAAA